MSGTLSPLGTITIGRAIPCLADLNSRIRGSLGYTLPSVNAQVQGLAKVAVSPPKVSVGASAAAAGVAALRAQVAVGSPGASLSLGLLTGAAAKLQANIGALNAHLSAGVALGALLGTAGVQAYSYSGAAGQLGPALTTATGSGFPGGGGAAANCNALILATQIGSTWSAMQLALQASSANGLSYLGNLSLGACLPLALAGVASLSASVGVSLPQLTAQLAAFLVLSPQITITQPSLSANLTAAVKLAAQLAASVSISPPQLAITLSLLPQLTASLGTLNAQLAFCVALPLAVGGIYAYSYSGDIGSFGATLSAALGNGFPGGSPSSNANAVILATESPATWSAMTGALKTA